MAERRKNGQFAKGSSGNASGRTPKADSTPASNIPRFDGGWTNWATGHGVGGRDKREGTFFTTQQISFDALAEIWKGDDLAARAVETPVKEALRPGFDIILPENKEGGKDDDDTESERVNDVLEKMRKLGAKQILYQALCTERGLGGGCILLGANDGSTDLTKPLNLEEVSEFNWMTPLEPREIIPMYGYADPRQPKYGQPEIYRMVSRAVLPPFSGQYAETVFDIHESRLLPFPGIRVSRYQPNASQGGWGDSVLVRMWRILRDFNLAWGSAGVLVTEFARGTYKWKDLLETISTDRGRQGAEARLQFMEWAASTINATVIDSNDDYKREAIPLAGLADLLNQFATRLSASADQPITVLFGTSPAGLNATGDSDIRLFYDRIAAYQQDKVLPALETIVKLCFLTTGDGSIPDNWSIRFRPLWQETAEDRSKAMLTQAQADHTWFQDGVISAEEIAESHWGAGDWNPELKIDFEARKKQQLATHAAVSESDLHALGKGNGPGPDGTPGGGALPDDHPKNPNQPPPPPSGSAPKAGEGSTSGGQNFPPRPADKDKAALPDPETPPTSNVSNADGSRRVELNTNNAVIVNANLKGGWVKGNRKPSPDEDDVASRNARGENDADPGDKLSPEEAGVGQHTPKRLRHDHGGYSELQTQGQSADVQPPGDPDPWGARSDDDDDDSDLASAVAALHAHLQKKQAKKGKIVPPPPQGSFKPSSPTTPAGKPAAPDPNTPPQDYVLGNDSAGTPQERTNPPAAIDYPSTERADFNPDQPRAEDGKFGSGGGAKEAVETSKKQGGMTLDPRTGAHPKQGYSVSIRDGFTVDGKDGLKPEHIQKLLDDNKDILKSDTKSHVGTWFNADDNKWYLDISHVEPTLNEGVRYGRENKQLGIYDLAHGSTIKAEEYEAAEKRQGRFANHDSEDPKPSGPGSGSRVRSTNHDGGGDGEGDESPRGDGAEVVGAGYARGRSTASGANQKLDFDPDQPRAENGQFGSGGGAKEAEKTENGAETNLSEPLSSSEVEAIKTWSGDAYADINDTARNGNPALYSEIRHLDSAIAKSIIAKDMTLYRGIDDKRVKGLGVGRTMYDAGYSATSNNRGVAETYAHEHGNGRGTVMEIKVRSGDHALTIKGRNDYEDELLLPRRSRFKVTGTRQDPKNDVLEVELV